MKWTECEKDIAKWESESDDEDCVWPTPVATTVVGDLVELLGFLHADEPLRICPDCDGGSSIEWHGGRIHLVLDVDEAGRVTWDRFVDCKILEQGKLHGTELE